MPLSSERAIESKELRNKFSNPSATSICNDMNAAIKAALAHKEIERVVIFGSFYTIADATLILDEI